MRTVPSASPSLQTDYYGLAQQHNRDAYDGKGHYESLSASLLWPKEVVLRVVRGQIDED